VAAGSHPIQRRYLAEDLIRLRRSDEGRRYAVPHRSARIDPKPPPDRGRYFRTFAIARGVMHSAFGSFILRAIPPF
jgi:hypothetical protein